LKRKPFLKIQFYQTVKKLHQRVFFGKIFYFYAIFQYFAKMGIFFPYSAQKQGGVLIDAFLKTSPNLSKRKGKDGQESIQKMRHPLVLSSLVDAATTKQEETIL
jgi:hypothetical protein